MNLVRVELSRQADEDILAAALYYDPISGTLLNRFYKNLAVAQQHIARFPSAGLNRYAHELSIPNLRYWPLNDFPYALFYIEQSTHCVVVRCAHLASDIPTSLIDTQAAVSQTLH